MAGITDGGGRRAHMRIAAQPARTSRPAPQTASSGKQAVLAQLDARTLVPFHSGLFSKGHASTDYRRWAFASNVSARGRGACGGVRAQGIQPWMGTAPCTVLDYEGRGPSRLPRLPPCCLAPPRTIKPFCDSTGTTPTPPTPTPHPT